MKTRLLFLSILSLALFGACGDAPIAKRATGLAYEIVVVMEPTDWNGEMGKAVKADLASEVRGLPSSEPAMRITYASPSNFNGLLTYVKNIFILNLNPSLYTQVSLRAEKDRWAQGQVVLTMNAPSKEEAIAYLTENERILVEYFNRVELSRGIELAEKNYNRDVTQMIEDKLGVTFKVPEAMTYYRESGIDFFWASNNAPTGRTDVLIYTFPYEDPETFTRDYLVAKRDSVLKINMPGSFPNSYMTTETHYVKPSYTAITLYEKYCGVLRGLWKMQGDMMGGPFVSHARLDEENNRVVVVEGFVYSPESDKRNYIRRVEAALYTLRLPGDATVLPAIQVLPADLK